LPRLKQVRPGTVGPALTRWATPPGGSFRCMPTAQDYRGARVVRAPIERVWTMKPRISVVTLGVADLERSLAFYRDGLGLPTQGIVGREFEHGAVAFFDLSGGLKLAIWAQDDICHDTGLPKTPVSPTAFTIGHNVMHKEDVAAVMDAARRVGNVPLTG